MSYTLERILADPLAPAAASTRAVGFIGADVPADVLAAPGISAAHLPWQRDRATPFADRWLEDAFPGWSRSMLQDWADGRFDFMSHVVFTRGDDASQRLYYYVTELQRRRIVGGASPVIFDTARIRRPASEAWNLAAVRRLAADLDVNEDDLVEGIGVTNRRRVAMHDLDRDRNAPGHFYEQVARATLFAPLDTLDLDTRPADPGGHGRVLLAGSAPPDDSLHRAVEAAGWNVVGDVNDRNLARLGPPVDTGKDPVSGIGRQVSRTTSGARSFHDRGATLAAETNQRRVDAVVFWLHEQDEALAWDVVRAERAVAQLGKPVLVLSRRQWDLSDEPAADVAAFLGGLHR